MQLSNRDIQIKLKFMCYYSGAIDGILGRGSKGAIVAFQRSHNLAVDGICGAKTSASIAANYNWHMQNNSRNVLIQRYLYFMDYYRGAIDGIIGRQSLNAITNFQRDHNLVVDGIVGKLTWGSLVANYNWHVQNDAISISSSSGSSVSGVNVNCENMSAHFKRSEFRCTAYCNGYPTTLSPQLIANLETMRSHFGRPITITCGLRCRTYNNILVRKGWAIPNSKHTQGKAADIYIPGVNKQAIINYWYRLPGAHYAYTNNRNMGVAVHVDVN